MRSVAMRERCAPAPADARPDTPDLATPPDPILDPMQRSAHEQLAARVHADAAGSDEEIGEATGRSRRTANRWRRQGKGSPADVIGRYVLAWQYPFRLLAWVKATIKRRVIEGMSRAELIERYREILAAEKEREARDTILDLTPDACWLDRAAASEADAALDEEKSALERRFAELRVTDAEVRGGR